MADSSDNARLTARQYNAIAALLSEPNVRRAAEAAKVPERTLYAWLKRPDFVAEYRTARREATGQAIARLQQHSGSMATVLLAVAADSRQPAASRIAAASKALDLAIRSVEVEDLQRRLEALETRHEQEFR